MPTERALPAAAELDALSPLAVVRLLAAEEQKSVRAVARTAPRVARVAAQVAGALGAGGRLIYVGAGTSGRLATLDASEIPPTFGTSPAQVVAVMAGGARALRRAVEGAEDGAAEAVAALARLGVSGRDVVVGITASGATPFVAAALAHARARGAVTALVTCAPSAIAADTTIRLDVGPEVLAGSTRLKAGTATKLVLNAITTAAMVTAGKCYGPRMVDLRAGSAKLRDRARRMVVELGRVDAGEADRVLGAARGRVKVAVVMARLAVDRATAVRRLAAAGGKLRALIGAP